MVLGLVTSDGDVLHLFIFPCSLRLNTEAYIKSLEEIVLSWTKNAPAGSLYAW